MRWQILKQLPPYRSCVECYVSILNRCVDSRYQFYLYGTDLNSCTSLFKYTTVNVINKIAIEVGFMAAYDLDEETSANIFNNNNNNSEFWCDNLRISSIFVSILERNMSLTEEYLIRDRFCPQFYYHYREDISFHREVFCRTYLFQHVGCGNLFWVLRDFFLWDFFVWNQGKQKGYTDSFWRTDKA